MKTIVIKEFRNSTPLSKIQLVRALVTHIPDWGLKIAKDHADKIAGGEPVKIKISEDQISSFEAALIKLDMEYELM